MIFNPAVEGHIFDGEINWDMQELKQGNIKYFLNIKARKQGHRGALEEISMKGRGGRVGKGYGEGKNSWVTFICPGFIIKAEKTPSSPGRR